MKLSKLFSKLISTAESNALFDDIIGCDHIKKLFKMALDSESAVHILLVGPRHHLKNSYFADGANSTKSGMIDYLLANRPQYLLFDEIDKMTNKDQAFLLNLMETGIVSETKYCKTQIGSDEDVCICNKQ